MRSSPTVAAGLIACSLALAHGRAMASTAAFAGKVIEVTDAPQNRKDCLKQFAVEINYLDYVS